MTISRRQILGGLGAMALTRGHAQQQPPSTTPPPPAAVPDGPRVPRPRTAPKPRTTPAVCLYSQHLIKVEYEAVGMVLRDLGFDGADLAVVPGSHVPPEQANSDLMRAIEAISGVGLEIPIISTNVVRANDPYGRQILGVAGFMGIGLFRPGYWKFGGAPREARIAEVQRELLQVASIARAYNVATAFHNGNDDCVGAHVADVNSFLRGIDPRWLGYDFDPGYAAEASGPGAADSSFNLALPRLKAVTVRDLKWSKDGKPAPCPLGEGAVDWHTFFTGLARAHYVGPITIQVAYPTTNELNAFRRDLEFVRKQIAATYNVG
jgi:L-ribulose-5-phosphate 3-epimerase